MAKSQSESPLRGAEGKSAMPGPGSDKYEILRIKFRA